MFPDQAFALGAFPFPAHKPVGDEDVDQVDRQEEGPEEHRPEEPVVFRPVFQDLIDDDQEYAAYQEDHKMRVKPFFLSDTALGVFHLFVLFQVQLPAIFVFGEHPNGYL